MTSQELQQLVAQLIGRDSLPTESSNIGQFGSYDMQGLTEKQLGELFKYNSQGFVPLEGTSGGVNIGPMAHSWNGVGEFTQHNKPTDALYQLQYTPNYAGSKMASEQDIAQEEQGSAMLQALGMALTGFGLGGGFAGAENLANGGTWASAIDAAKANSLMTALSGAGNMSQSEMMKLMSDFGAKEGMSQADVMKLMSDFGVNEAATGVNSVDQASLFNGLGDTTADISAGLDASSFVGPPADLAGKGTSSWLTNVFGKEGASLVKSIAPDLWKAVVAGVATDKQKKDFEALANKAAEMANPGAYFQRNTIWPALEEAIKAGNKPNADTLAGLHELMQSGADPNSDLRKQSANGFAAANDLVTNPMGNSGYSLADQAAQLYASLNSDPYSNPLISQTFQNAMEAAARKSAASGRLQGGNFLADSRNATTGAVVDASGKLGTQYGNAITSGMNMYDTQFKDALGLGTGAAGTANQNITAGAGGLNSLANLQQAGSNYIKDLGNIAGFGSPEAASAVYNRNQTTANQIDPWANVVNNGGAKIVDTLINKFL